MTDWFILLSSGIDILLCDGGDILLFFDFGSLFLGSREDVDCFLIHQDVLI